MGFSEVYVGTTRSRHWPTAPTQPSCLTGSNSNAATVVSASGRASLLNGLNCSLPQMLDRVSDNGEVTPGLWDSLSTIIGAGSTANKAASWRAFHMSDSIFASDQVKEIGTLKTRYTRTLESLGEEPSPDSILSKKKRV